MMLTKSKKRYYGLFSIIIIALLILASAFMLTPQKTAEAEDGDAVESVTVKFGNSVTEYTGIAEAWTYANGLTTTENIPAVVTMQSDAVTTDTLTVAAGKFITLDLNGCMLKYNNDTTYNSVITVNGTFTLKDSNTDTTKKHEITDHDGEAIEVTGGVITGGTGTEVWFDKVHRYFYGGGVYVSASGTFVMNGGNISGNNDGWVDCGGGVSVNGGTFIMNDGNISYNYVDSDGGGVYVDGVTNEEGELIAAGTFTMNGGTIGYNVSDSDGGGVEVEDGTFKMSGGVIRDNMADYGGGVDVDDGTFKMSGGTISENISNFCGGVYVDNGGTINVSGAPNITGNKNSDNSVSNVYLEEGQTITVTGTLTEGAKIGVDVEVAGDIATGFTQGDKASKYFIPDDPTYCIYISDEDTGTVTIDEHNYGDFTVDKQPTCTEAGSKSKHCTRCDEKGEVTAIDPLGHDYGEFVTDKQPTCTEAGSKSKHCANCDEKSEVTAIPTIPHTLNHNPAKPATEDKDGNIEYWECEDCEKIFSDEDGKTEITDKASIVIPKLTDGGSSGDDILWIIVIVLSVVAIALGGYIAFDVLRGKRKEIVINTTEQNVHQSVEGDAAPPAPTDIKPEPAEEKSEVQLDPAEIRESVVATEVDSIMSDEVAESLIEKSDGVSDKTKQGIINIDTLSQVFESGETVTLDEIKNRVKGFNKKTTYIKVLARGTLDKALTVEADNFSLQAVKMIVLTGGKVRRIQN